jgi:TPR repeat protein
MAANAGGAHAQTNLGNLYKNGRGVSKDYTAALELYRKAAKQGHVGAQANLAEMYYRVPY